MQDVLVLNSTYEPIQVLSLKKAIKLIMKQRAHIEKQRGDMVLKSAHDTMPLPSVIRLQNYIRYQRKPVMHSKRNILVRDKFTCQYCSFNTAKEKEKIKLTIDHVIPTSRGGKNDWDNTVACCVKCNTAKGNKTLKEFEEESGLTLLKQPRRPSPLMFMKRFSQYEEWQEYLLFLI